MTLETHVFGRALGHICQLDGAYSQSMQDVLSARGEGVGRFSVAVDDEKLALNPTALAYQNIVVTHDTLSDFWFPWIIERKSRIKRSGESDAWVISGDGARTALKHCSVLSERWSTDNYPTTETRWLNWAAPVGIWYVDAEWNAPMGVLWSDEANDRRRQPAGFPDHTAYWIWPTDPDADSDPGERFFRSSIHLDDPTFVSMFMTADNEFKFYLNGEMVVTGADFRANHRYDVMLPAGDHILAAGVTNFAGAPSPAGFLFAMYESSPRTLNLISLLRHSDTAAWVCREWLDGPAGWDPGDIVKTFVAEGKGRGINTAFARIKCDWTNDLSEDSGGVAWSAYQRRARSFPLGTKLLQVVQSLSEGDCDFQTVWDPTDPVGAPNDTLLLKVWRQQGQDLTLGDDPMILREARDIASATYDGDDSQTATRLIMKTDGGWYQQDAAGAEIIREDYVSIGGTDNPANAADLAVQAFAAAATAAITATFEVLVEPGKIPMKDYGVGDYLFITNQAGALERTRLVGMTIADGEDDRVVYVPEFDTMPLSSRARLTRWMRSMMPGTMGGSIVSAQPASIPKTAGKTMRPYSIPFSLIGDVVVSASPSHTIEVPSLITELFARVETVSPDDDITVGYYQNGVSIGTVTIVHGQHEGRTYVSVGADIDDEVSVGVIDPGTGAKTLVAKIRAAAVS